LPNSTPSSVGRRPFVGSAGLPSWIALLALALCLLTTGAGCAGRPAEPDRASSASHARTAPDASSSPTEEDGFSELDEDYLNQPYSPEEEAEDASRASSQATSARSSDRLDEEYLNQPFSEDDAYLEEEFSEDDYLDQEYTQEEESLDSQDSDERLADPLEPLNRVIFVVNDKLYYWLLKPAAQVYEAVVPKPLRLGVNNFFNNIRYPVRLANDLLQFKLERAGRETLGFLSNTIFGLGGLINISGKGKYDILRVPEEDLGQTMGVWGVGDGFYLVLPLLGPSTLRDAVGRAGDTGLDPMFWFNYFYLEELWEGTALSVGERVNETSLRLGEYESFMETAIDPYAAMRDAYYQLRRQKVKE
jgi:phospholipid-binding lipoprotein MlaA